jgi:hypothetical protein
MLYSLSGLVKQAKKCGGQAKILTGDAIDLGNIADFAERKAKLIVTSPPYPGVHVLYHRWHVDGRRETPAPYWIAGCNDGQRCAPQ